MSANQPYGENQVISEEVWVSKFEKVYRQYFDRLYAYARVICKSQPLAKDVVSDFFFNLYKNKVAFESIKNLEVYLFVSIKNQAVQACLRDNKELKQENEEVFRQMVDHINPEELLLEKELKKELDRLINELPDQCQLVFRMAKEKGLKYQEIADELGIGVETVKSQLKKAQSNLRSKIIDFYLDRTDAVFPDVRLIGQFLIAIGLQTGELM
ncbi:RNA polymerase sigma factor [Marinoscillum sp. MHG1-6]|uniref:RNA polymerase sigma factor n=1 Tax=Marinoscillum sp. MHG1-6 TaxID=2959627 RepID=UPI0021578720|nr:RNA polymerase sigma-70 factor [Marinoscillum sp. MHG1-6]